MDHFVESVWILRPGWGWEGELRCAESKWTGPAWIIEREEDRNELWVANTIASECLQTSPSTCFCNPFLRCFYSFRPCRQCSSEVLQQSPSGLAEVKALAVNPSPSVKQVGVADSSGMVFFYDLEKHQLLNATGPFGGAISSMAWHPMGKFLVLGLEAGNLHGLILEGGNITELEPGTQRNVIWVICMFLKSFLSLLNSI